MLENGRRVVRRGKGKSSKLPPLALKVDISSAGL